MKYKKNLIIIIFFFIILSIISKKRKHKFWTIDQPIVFDKKKLGILKNIKDFYVEPLPNFLNKINYNNDNLHLFLNFINKYFEDQLLYTIDYFKWHQNNSINNNLVYGLINQTNEIYGVVSGNITYLSISNSVYKTVYGDFLCTNKKYRSLNNAPILISFIIDYMKKNECLLSLIKVDSKKHYFRHFNESNYYIYNLNKYYKKKSNKINNLLNIKILNNESDIDIYLDKIYDLYNKTCKKYKLFEILTKSTLKTKLYSNITYSIIIELDNILIGYCILYKLYYTTMKDYIYIFYHIIGLHNNYIMDELVNILYNNKINIISAVNNPETDSLIKYLNMTKGEKSYYYLYNYGSNLKYNDILLFY